VDNAKELNSGAVKAWLKSRGITLQNPAPYAHASNGVAERFNRTIIELARAMLIARNLPAFLWESAVEYAAYIRNRSPTRALRGKTPLEAWTRKKPNVSHLREFGCEVWVKREPVQKLSKLGRDHEKAEKFIFVGFGDHTDIVKYYDGKNRAIRESRNVVWVEPSTQPPVDVQLEGELGTPSQQSPAEDPAQPASMENQKTVPSEGEPPTQIESHQQAQRNSQQQMQTQSQSTSTPPLATSLSKISPAQAESDQPRRSSRQTKDTDYRKLNNPAVTRRT
jgi:hypothetical protein